MDVYECLIVTGELGLRNSTPHFGLTSTGQIEIQEISTSISNLEARCAELEKARIFRQSTNLQPCGLVEF